MHRTCYTFLSITEFLLIYNHAHQAHVVTADIQLRVELRLGPAALHPSLHRSQDTVPTQTLHPLLTKASQSQVGCCLRGAACTACTAACTAAFPFPLLQLWAQPWWTAKLLPHRQPCLTAHSQQSSHSLRVHDSSYWKKKKEKKK